jgi:hypothetical protein
MIPPETTDHPVSKLVADIIDYSGLRTCAFVQSIGYLNITKGARNLNRLLQDGTADQAFLERIQEVYGRRDEFERALLEAARIEKELREEEGQRLDRLDRENFRQYIYVKHSLRTPTSITAAAFSGAGWRFLYIPRLVRQRSEEALLGWVAWRARRHFHDSHGKLPLFGEITGYEWVKYRDSRISLDTRGKNPTKKSGVLKVGGPLLVIKNKSIEPRIDGHLSTQPSISRKSTLRPGRDK